MDKIHSPGDSGGQTGMLVKVFSRIKGMKWGKVISRGSKYVAIVITLPRNGITS
jgi:hypothetical protein